MDDQIFKSTIFSYKIREIFVFCLFYNVHKEHMFTIKIEDGREASYLYINLACLSVCLYPINVKTAEPIRPNFLWDI